MNVITTAFILLALYGLGKAQFTTSLEEQGVSSESEGPSTENRPLSERANVVSGELAGSPSTEESLETACSKVVVGAYFDDDDTETELQTLDTDSILQCCSACQELENCTAWMRNRESSFCLLYEIERAVAVRFAGSYFDLGWITDSRGLPEIGERTDPRTTIEISINSVVDGVAQDATVTEVVVSDCEGIRGVTYPMGDVIVAGDTGSAYFCCNVCRNSDNCNSWFFNENTNNCVLNRNVPEPRERSSSQFEGDAVAK